MLGLLQSKISPRRVVCSRDLSYRDGSLGKGVTTAIYNQSYEARKLGQGNVLQKKLPIGANACARQTGEREGCKKNRLFYATTRQIQTSCFFFQLVIGAGSSEERWLQFTNTDCIFLQFFHISSSTVIKAISQLSNKVTTSVSK